MKVVSELLTYSNHGNGTNVRAGGIKLLGARDEGETHNKHVISRGTRTYTAQDLIDETGSTHALNVQHATSEVRHIGFVKVHKAASSTMQNIFFRFGIKRGLTFVFTTHPNYFSRSSMSHLPVVRPSKRTSYDILCNHGVFNKSIYSSLLPEDTVYLAIVREPLDLFISSVNYYTQRRYLLDYLARTPGNKVQNLIQHADRYDKSLLSYTRNSLARDLGFTNLAQNDTKSIVQKLNELGDALKLVLLVEYFDESLILMKRYLNWKLQDILYLSNNVYKKDGFSLKDLTPDDLDKFKDRNYLDFYVYNYFHKKFWEQFEMETSDIHQEILHFKSVLTTLKTFCNVTPISSEVLVVEKSNWNEEIHVTRDDCKYMLKEELDFIKELREIQGSQLKVIRKSGPLKLQRFPRMYRRLPGN